MDEAKILEQFHQAYPFFGEEALHSLADKGKILDIARKEAFVRRGAIDQRIGFVISGLFKGAIMEYDDEQTLWFSNELDILASYSSILKNQPSKLTYEALEDSTVFVIDYAVIRDLASTDLKMAGGLIHMLEQLLLESFHRLERFVLLSAEERYLQILEEKPGIINRVPQKLLASYIGITPVSLSRLRSRLSKR